VNAAEVIVLNVNYCDIPVPTGGTVIDTYVEARRPS
jgi:hypothetical protein